MPRILIARGVRASDALSASHRHPIGVIASRKPEMNTHQSCLAQASMPESALPYTTVAELAAAWRAGTKFLLHYHGQEPKLVTSMRLGGEGWVKVCAGAMLPVGIRPDGSCWDAPGKIWVELAGPQGSEYSEQREDAREVQQVASGHELPDVRAPASGESVAVANEGAARSESRGSSHQLSACATVPVEQALRVAVEDLSATYSAIVNARGREVVISLGQFGRLEKMKQVLAARAQPTVNAPSGYALVPLRMTRAMRKVIEDGGWEWKDLLAAAEAITAEQYNDECNDTVATNWFDAVVRLERMASAAIHQSPADQRNVLEDLAGSLSRLTHGVRPSSPS